MVDVLVVAAALVDIELHPGFQYQLLQVLTQLLLVLVARGSAKLTEHRVHLLYSVLLRQLVAVTVQVAHLEALLGALVDLAAAVKVRVLQLQVALEILHQLVQVREIMAATDSTMQTLVLEVVEDHLQ